MGSSGKNFGRSCNLGCELFEPGIGSNTLRTDHASYPGSQAGRPCGLKVSGVGVAQIRCRNLGRQGFEFGSTCRPQICMYVYIYIYVIYLSKFIYVHNRRLRFSRSG